MVAERLWERISAPLSWADGTSTAHVTGTITNGRVADAPGFDPAGQTVAITVSDDGRNDSAGVDLSFFGSPHAIPPCQSVYPYLSIDEGNFSVSA